MVVVNPLSGQTMVFYSRNLALLTICLYLWFLHKRLYPQESPQVSNLDTFYGYYKIYNLLFINIMLFNNG